MKSLCKRLVKVAVGLGATVGCCALFLVAAKADLNSSWLSTADPAIQKVTDLPANQPPALTNRDCLQTTYTNPDNSTGSACFVATNQGLIEVSGSSIIFPSTSEAFPINSFVSNSFLVPLPGQDSVLATTSAPLVGTYLHTYDKLSQEIAANYGMFPRRIVSYSLKKGFDRDIRDANGSLMTFNTYGTLATSANGQWIIVDSPGKGFMRINLNTLAITPFAPSLNGPNDYSSPHAETAISDDGRYAVIANTTYSYFKIYDLSTCSGSTNNSYSQPLNCQSKDYWSSLGSKISGFHTIYEARFVNDDNLMATLTYNWQSGSSYSAATFRITAPGKAAHGIDYLALGDSYISGEGEFVYKDGTDTANNSCHVSPQAYPYLLGVQGFNSYESVACSGARTNDVINSSDAYQGQVRDRIARKDRDSNLIETNFQPGYIAQKEFITTYQPQVVTLSLGGNDMGFSDVIKECAEWHIGIGSSNNCFDTYDERLQVVKAIDTVFGRLQTSFRQIQAADPGVRLYVIGYPQVVTGGDCADNVRLNDAKISFAKLLVNYLDWVVRRAADSSGVSYVDNELALSGHRLCETNSQQIAINGLTAGDDGGPLGLKLIGSESYHPNVLGHQLLAQNIWKLTSGLTAPMPPPNPSIGQPTANDTLAQLLLNGYVANNAPQPDIVAADDSMSEEVAVAGKNQAVSLAGQPSGLAPNTSYQVSLRAGSTVTGLATLTSSNTSDISGQVAVPASLSPGPQLLQIVGPNMAGQTIEIYKLIYVAASDDDYDGDGVPNMADLCLIVPPSGRDVDRDGIDDACDPLIGAAPVPTYPVTAKLTSNMIYIINPGH